MIFAHARDAIFKRIKWQTRRLFKPGDRLEGNRVIGINKNGKEFTRWQIGSTYAIQEGRGTNSIGRIQITGIRLDTDIRNILLKMWKPKDSRHARNLSRFGRVCTASSIRRGCWSLSWWRMPYCDHIRRRETVYIIKRHA